MDAPNENVMPIVSRPGIPANVRDNRQTYEKQFAVYVIIPCLACERSAFYILDYSLITALTSNQTLAWTSEASSTAYYIFEGINFVWMLIFAVISDAKLGRVKTISIGFPVFLVGLILITLIVKSSSPVCPLKSSTDEVANGNETAILNEICAPLVVTTLIFTAIGSAAVRSSLIVFGVDQIQESRLTSQYFDKCIVALHLGSIAVSVAHYYGAASLEPNFIIFIIATSFTLVSTLLFFIGWRYYTHVKPYDSVIINCIPVVNNALKTWRQCRKNQRTVSSRDRTRCASDLTDASHIVAEEEVEESTRTNERPPTFLDFAKVAHNGKFLERIVDDVKALRTAIVLFLLLFPYRLIYSQLYSILGDQGNQMQQPNDRPVLVLLTDISEPLIVIIGVFVLNVFFYKYLNARNWRLTIATKFIISMTFAIITMCIASIVEIVRQKQCYKDMTTSNLTIYAQLPQDILMGIAQLFNLLASFEFAYFVAPRSAQSLFMAFHSVSVGIVSYVSEGYSLALSKYSYTLDFTCPTVHAYGWFYPTYFLILAALQLIFIVIFLVCYKKLGVARQSPQ